MVGLDVDLVGLDVDLVGLDVDLVGLDVVEIVGKVEGLLVGLLVTPMTGAVVGTDVIVVVGKDVGAGVLLKDGILLPKEGAALGLANGLDEGLLLLIDGESEGRDDGPGVGWEEGKVDGLKVGIDDGDSDELSLDTEKVSVWTEPNSPPSTSVFSSKINFQ